MMYYSPYHGYFRPGNSQTVKIRALSILFETYLATPFRQNLRILKHLPWMDGTFFQDFVKFCVIFISIGTKNDGLGKGEETLITKHSRFNSKRVDDILLNFFG